jgi:hypothetical protein
MSSTIVREHWLSFVKFQFSLATTINTFKTNYSIRKGQKQFHDVGECK